MVHLVAILLVYYQIWCLTLISSIFVSTQDSHVARTKYQTNRANTTFVSISLSTVVNKSWIGLGETSYASKSKNKGTYKNGK